jgi:asparagine synthetase B (glutamine-hydrolysing)
LNIAVGYGADNMFGGYGNSWPSPNGDIVRNDIKRYQQWYLSLDVDFEKIPTKKKWVKSMFFVLNAIKFPAPTLMLSNGKWSSQWLYY